MGEMGTSAEAEQNGTHSVEAIAAERVGFC